MTICYFGIYNPEYGRNRVIIKGLKKNGVKIIECRSQGRGLIKYWNLLKKYVKIKEKYDLMVVGYPGYQAMILARFLTRKPIIFDVFTSIYEAMICDRKLVKANSLKALYFWSLDWLSCQLADKILLDTQEQIDYFVKTFYLKPEKFYRLFVGTDEDLVYPLPTLKKENENFLVHFHGNFIPLQGIEYIIRAAKTLELEKIHFNIIGKGQEYEKIIKLAKELGISNISFIDPVPYDQLKEYMAVSDICLGIFGNTNKTQRVIPNKVFEAIACAKPVITAESPAMKELFIDQENIIMSKPADADDLAEKILKLKLDQNLRLQIGQRAFNLFQSKLLSKNIIHDLLIKIKNDSL